MVSDLWNEHLLLPSLKRQRSWKGLVQRTEPEPLTEQRTEPLPQEKWIISWALLGGIEDTSLNMHRGKFVVFPTHSMYAIYIYAYIGVVWGVNVGIYGIHGVYGFVLFSRDRNGLGSQCDLFDPFGDEPM